jgi:proteic killer suppression protein
MCYTRSVQTSWKGSRVEVSFASLRLRRVCESAKNLQRAYGKPCAKKLMARLADLRAAPNLEDLRRLPGRCHELDGDRAGQLALDLPDGRRLVFEPTENPHPVKEDGGLDWRRVEAIRVIEIVDYHG